MKRIAPIVAALLSLLLYVVVFAQDLEGTINKGANLRAGPGTTFAIVGKATQGQAVTITDKNDAGDWYQLDTGEWIAAFLVTLDAAPVATKAPSATATPTMQVTQADILSDPIAQTYITDMQQAIDLFVNGSDVIGEQFKLAGENASVMFTDKWKITVGIGLASLQMSSEALQTLEPPSYFVDMHDDMLILADHIDIAVPLLTEGIDGFDADKLKAGSAEYLLAVNSMNSAQTKLEALIAAAKTTPTPLPATPTKTPTRRPTATKTPSPTVTIEAVATESTISDATSANEWVNASAEQRVAIVHHFYELWQKSTGNRVKISEQEMAVCVNAQVASPDTPLTMMILALAANCIK